MCTAKTLWANAAMFLSSCYSDHERASVWEKSRTQKTQCLLVLMQFLGPVWTEPTIGFTQVNVPCTTCMPMVCIVLFGHYDHCIQFKMS